jgi:hypothetical protein
VVILAEEGDFAKCIKPLGLSKGDCERVLESQPLVVTLMIEKCKGRRSRWKPYLAFLPQSWPGLPALWPVRRYVCQSCHVSCCWPATCTHIQLYFCQCRRTMMTGSIVLAQLGTTLLQDCRCMV